MLGLLGLLKLLELWLKSAVASRSCFTVSAIRVIQVIMIIRVCACSVRVYVCLSWCVTMCACACVHSDSSDLQHVKKGVHTRAIALLALLRS